MHPFDRNTQLLHRDRAARMHGPRFLLEEACERLAERLDDITRDFPLCLDLGCHDGTLARRLQHHPRIGTLINAERSGAQLAHAPAPACRADEEALPFAPASLDAVFSVLSLHGVNDLPGTLAQIERALKPDGLFLAILAGGDTLHELRTAFATAEATLTGGLSPRISPFLDVRDAGALLQRAGFALPVVDSDRIALSYETPFALMHELRAMGEASALTTRPRHFTPRRLMAAMASAYPTNLEGRIDASIDFITLTAWKRADTQPQPAQRGSGKISLVSALS